MLGVCFLILAVLVGLRRRRPGHRGTGRGVRAARLDHFLVRPGLPLRRGWAGRLLVALVGLVASGVAAGVFAWLGAASQHAGLSFTTLLGGRGQPRAAGDRRSWASASWPSGSGPGPPRSSSTPLLGWSLLLVIVGGIGTVSHWVLDTSVFHHMASAPAVRRTGRRTAIMAAIGICASLVGGLAFSRRDLQGE